MSKRATDEDLHAGIWPVEIESSSLGDAGEVILEVDDETGSTTMEAETWGIAGVASRPRDGSSALGYAKALRVQLGESVIVLATYDPRNMVACEPGEVCVFALAKDGASRAYVKLRPDGVVQVEGVRTEMHGSADAAALASEVAKLRNAFATHTHGGVTTGSGSSSAPTIVGPATLPAASAFASAMVKIGS